MPNLTPVPPSIGLDPEDAAQILVRLLATPEETHNLAVIDGRTQRCLEDAGYYKKLRSELAEKLLHAHMGLANIVDPLDYCHRVGVDPFPEVTRYASASPMR